MNQDLESKYENKLSLKESKEAAEQNYALMLETNFKKELTFIR